MELKNETSKSNSLFLCRKHEIKAHFSALHTLVEMGYSKEKIMLQKRKRISSEPGRPIFSGYLFCQRFPAASCRSQDAHLIVMGCVVFAPASEADVFGNASQAVPGRTLRSRSVFFCLSAHTQRQGFFCQCVPIESLGTQFAFGAFLA